MSSLGHALHSKSIVIAEVLRAIITRPIYPNSKTNTYSNLLSLTAKPLFAANHDLVLASRNSSSIRSYTSQAIAPKSTSLDLIHSPLRRGAARPHKTTTPESQFSKKLFSTTADATTDDTSERTQNATPPITPSPSSKEVEAVEGVKEVRQKGRYLLVHDSNGKSHWARKHILKKPKRKPSTVAEYNKNILNMVLRHQLNKAIKVFREMENRQIFPDVHTYTTIINGFAKQGDMTRAYKWYQRLLGRSKSLFHPDSLKPNVYVYTTLIDGYMRESNIDQAEAMFRVMMQKGISPNIATYNVLMHHSVVQFSTEAALKFWEKLLKAGLRPDVYTFAIMIHGFGNESRVDEAWRLFELLQKKGINVNTVLATTLMNMHTDHQDHQYAIELFYRFFTKNLNLKPSERTKAVLLKAVLHSSPLPKMYEYYEQYRTSLKQQQREKKKMKKKAKKQPMSKKSSLEGTGGSTAAPSSTAKVESQPHALFVGPSVYTFTTFMRAFLKHRDFRMVSAVYADMLAHNVQPSVVTFSVMMYSFSCLGEAETCYRILEELRRMSYQQQQQNEASEGTAASPQQSNNPPLQLNAVLYNIVISAFGKAGKWENAKYIYDLMKQDGIKPDKYTMEAFRHARNAGFYITDEDENNSTRSERGDNQEQPQTDLNEFLSDEALDRVEEWSQQHESSDRN